MFVGVFIELDPHLASEEVVHKALLQSYYKSLRKRKKTSKIKEDEGKIGGSAWESNPPTNFWPVLWI